MADQARCRGTVWLLVVACLSAVAAEQGVPLSGGKIMPTRPRPGIAQFVLDVTLVRGAPACGPARSVILVNGLFQPVLYANVNDTIRIIINNRLPASLPSTSTGISLHWHGFNMWNDACWSDGTAYISQCPISPGTSYTYSFKADEAPGTYFWHDHSAMNRANGLQGVLILGMPVTKRPIETEYTPYGEHILFVTDWFDMEANRIAMRNNRPFPDGTLGPPSQETGVWAPVPNAANALLINGKGNAKDCGQDFEMRPGTGEMVPICNVTELVTLPINGRGGCQHEVFTVKSGEQYLFRLINGGTQQYVSVCFEGHTVVIVAADSVPTEKRVILPGSCVDINSGQRYDVLLTADNTAASSYWISVHQQYADVAPSAYAVLRYASSAPAQLPVTPTPRASAVYPWTPEEEAKVKTIRYLLSDANAQPYLPEYYNLFRYRAGYAPDLLGPGSKANKVVTFTMAQQKFHNGAIKWAMNDVAHVMTQPCKPVMDSLLGNPKYLQAFAAPSDTKAQQASTDNVFNVSVYNQSSQATFYNTDRGIPVKPVAGMHVVPLKYHEIVDVVINNPPQDPMGGSTRGQQHPMHLHGHKFWVLGSGNGTFDPNGNNTLRYVGGISRDTATVRAGGWLLLRFRADNPGVWPLHCHIMWHAYMGQVVLFAEALDRIPSRRKAGPPCPTECVNGFAPFTKSYLKKHYDLSSADFTPKLNLL